MSNFCFIDIPRTGSTTLRKLLGDDSRKHEWRCLKEPSRGDFIFTMVRHPYPRLVSLWSITDRRDGLSFAECLQKRLVQREVYVNPLAPERHYWPMLFRPQHEWLLKPVHYVGRFEEYEKSVKRIFEFDELGEDPDFNKKAAVGEYKSDWRDHYTPELAEIVYLHHRNDFARFTYDEECP